MNIFFYILYFGLIGLYFLFVFPFYFEINVCYERLVIKIFGIIIIDKRKEKMIHFISKFVPKSKDEVKKSIDYSSLISFIHIDRIIIDFKYKIDNYVEFIYLDFLINVIDLLTPKTIVLTRLKEKEKISISFHLNIGVLIVNVLKIRRKYKYEFK